MEIGERESFEGNDFIRQGTDYNLDNLPQEIKDVGFEFYFDFNEHPKKIWKKEFPVEEISIDDLSWHLSLPFWATPDGYYNLSPEMVIADNEKYSEEYKRVMEADISYPIDIVFYKNKWKIIDGLHRLTKLKMAGNKIIKVRKIPQQVLIDIVDVSQE